MKRAVTAVGAGVALLLVAGAGAAASVVVPPAHPAALPLTPVAMPAGESVFVCAPTPRLVGSTSGTDSAYAPGAKAAASKLGAVALSDGTQRVPGASIQAADGRTVKEISPALPQEKAEKPDSSDGDAFTGAKGVSAMGISMNDAAWLRVQPLGDQRSQGAATRTVNQGDGDLQGLAASSCLTPQNSFDLQGASTSLGHSAVLVVTNPSKNAASVNVTVSTQDGRAADGAIQPFTLGAGETRTLNLGGTAVDADAVHVHVDAAGAAVSAQIEQTILRGVKAGGVDIIQPSGAPGQTQIMAGVHLQKPEDSRKVGHSEDAGDETPQLQITDLSGQGTSAKVVARKADGSQTTVAEKVQIAPDAVASVDLTKLPAGVYTLEVQAEDVVSATARVVRGTDPKGARDVAYYPARDQLGTDQLIASPQLGSTAVDLAAPRGAAKATLAPVDGKGHIGKPRTVEIAAGHSQQVAFKDLGKDVVGVRIASTQGEVYGSYTVQEGKSGIGASVIPDAPQAPSSAEVDLEP